MIVLSKVAVAECVMHRYKGAQKTVFEIEYYKVFWQYMVNALCKTIEYRAEMNVHLNVESLMYCGADVSFLPV